MPNRTDVLIHCEGCADLLYLDECVPGKLIPDVIRRPGYELSVTGGRFCVPCARERGWFSPEDCSTLEQLLTDAGLLDQTRPWERQKALVRHRAPKVGADQGVLL